MEDFKRQIIDVLKDNDTVPPEGFTYFCEMLDWVLSIIKQDIEGGNDILSEDGLITYFDFDTVRYNLGIRSSSSFYKYSEFYICILQPLIKGLYGKGFNIDIDEIDDPVRRFKMTIHRLNTLIPITRQVLEQTNIMREFSAICEVVKVEDGEYNTESILEMCKCTDKLQKYDWNTEAVSKALQFMQHKNEKREVVEVIMPEKINTKNIVVPHWSSEFKNKVIELWQTKYVKKLGVMPKNGEAIKLFIPAMYDLVKDEFPEELKAHSVKKGGSKKTKTEVLNALYQRYMNWIEKPNKEAIRKGETPPYGILDIPEVNTPFVQIPEEVTTSVEYTTTVAEAKIHTYNVTFKYKFNGLFNRYRDFSQKTNGFTEGDAYCKVLPVFYKDKSFKDVKIKSSSIIVTQMD